MLSPPRQSGSVADGPIRCQSAFMKNIQITDDAVNATFSVFWATAE
jgi:hypothetical protein